MSLESNIFSVLDVPDIGKFNISNFVTLIHNQLNDKQEASVDNKDENENLEL